MIIRQGLTRRVASGIVYSTLTIIVTLIGQVIAVPVFLARWGVVVYGEWLVLTGTISLLTLLNLGIQAYVINVLIAKHLRGNEEEGIKTLQSSLLLYVILSALSLIFLIGILLLPNTLKILNIEMIPSTEAKVVLLVYGLIAIYGIFGGLLMGLFRVVQQTPRQLAYGLIERTIFLAVPIIPVFWGGSPANAAVWLGIVFFGLVLVELNDVRHRSPYPLGLSAANWHTARSLIKPSLMFFFISVSATVLMTGLNLLISRQVGAAAVAIFTTTLMLTNVVRTIINQGLNVIWPEITGISVFEMVSNPIARWQRLIIKLAGGLALLSSAGIIVFGPAIIYLWTSGSFSVDQRLINYFALTLIVQSPTLVSTMFGLALNRQSDLVWVNIMYVGAVLFVSWSLLGILGLNGAALALLLAQIILLPWQVYLACKWTSDSPLSFVSSIFIRWFPMLIFTLSGAFVLLGVQVIWLRILLFILIAVISVGLGFILWMTFEERFVFRQEMKKAWREIHPSRNPSRMVS